MFVAIVAAWALSSYNTPGPVRYIDVTEKSGIHFQVDSSPTAQKYLPESMVGGVGCIGLRRRPPNGPLLPERRRAVRSDAIGGAS